MNAIYDRNVFKEIIIHITTKGFSYGRYANCNSGTMPWQAVTSALSASSKMSVTFNFSLSYSPLFKVSMIITIQIGLQKGLKLLQSFFSLFACLCPRQLWQSRPVYFTKLLPVLSLLLYHQHYCHHHSNITTNIISKWLKELTHLGVKCTVW